MRGGWPLAVATLLLAGGCVPKAHPLAGVPAPANRRLPLPEIPSGHRKLVFTWHYTDEDFDLRGEGAARVAGPDSVRLDFFLPNGMGGYAAVIGDELRAPNVDMMRGLVPPPAFVWAALGRLATPPAADTIRRVEGDTLRADIGTEPRWRAAFVDDTLRSLERIAGGRIEQQMERWTPRSVLFRDNRAGRKLELTVTRSDAAGGFDDAIWR